MTLREGSNRQSAVIWGEVVGCKVMGGRGLAENVRKPSYGEKGYNIAQKSVIWGKGV